MVQGSKIVLKQEHVRKALNVARVMDCDRGQNPTPT